MNKIDDQETQVGQVNPVNDADDDTFVKNDVGIFEQIKSSKDKKDLDWLSDQCKTYKGISASTLRKINKAIQAKMEDLQ